jgi:hypothetical protein
MSRNTNYPGMSRRSDNLEEQAVLLCPGFLYIKVGAEYRFKRSFCKLEDKKDIVIHERQGRKKPK